MSISNHSDIDYINDGDDYDARAFEKLLEPDREGKRDRKSAKQRNSHSWRAVEEYFDDRRLKQALREYYDES